MKMRIGPSALIRLAPSAALVLASIPAANPVLAQDADFERFSFSLGVFITDQQRDTRLDVPDGPVGTPVDLGDDLGLDVSDTVFRVDGYYRFSEKHRIDFGAFDLSRSSRKQIEKDIVWNGTTYPLAADVQGDFDLNIAKLAYTWSFMRRDNGYAGLTAGLYVAEIGARLSAVGIADKDGGDVTAPLPVVGLRGEYDLGRKWTIRASGEFFALEYDNIDGSLVDIYAGIQYQLFEHMALGLGWNSVRIDVGVDDSDLNGKLDWGYDGGLLFFKFDF